MRAGSELIDIDAHPDVEVEVPGHVELSENGRPSFIPADVPRWLTTLAGLVGKEGVRCVFRRWKTRRSSPQNRYLWGPFYGTLLAGLRELYVGADEPCPFDTKERLHEAMKYMVLGVDVLRLPGGVELTTPATTTLLTPAQFNVYWRTIARWAAEKYRIYIPEPNERVAA